MADQYVGADEVEDLLEEMGISGDDEMVGAAKRAARRGRLTRRRVAPLSVEGRPRQFPFLSTRSVGLLDATAATLIATANRRALLQSMYVEANNAAGVRVFGISLTALIINGRNCVIGAGFIPAMVAFGDFAQAAGEDQFWSLGVVEQGGTADVTLLNDSGAAADLYVGFRAETTDG